MADKGQGWDSRAIAKVAKESYGGFEAMFRDFGWSERGSRMMISAPTHIKHQWGPVETFVRQHLKSGPDGRPLR